MIATLILCSFIALFIGALLGPIAADLRRPTAYPPPTNPVDEDFRRFMLAQGPREAWMTEHLRVASYAGAQRGK